MTKLIFILLWIFLFESNASQLDNFFEFDSPPQLYSKNDTGILPATSDNYEKILFNKDKVTVFQFYNSWCGHCQRYASIFKEFGKLVQNWNPIQVTAINCVDESNEEICRNYSIVAYPTIRLFWTNVANQNDTGKTVENLEFSAEFLRNAVLKFINENIVNKTVPSSWPNLKKIKLNDNEDFMNFVSKSELSAKSNIPIIAIAENNNSYIGQMIALELSNYQDKIKVLSLDIPSTNQLNFTVDTSAETALVQFNSSNKNSAFKILATLPSTEKNHTVHFVNYIDQNIFDNKLRYVEDLQTGLPQITTEQLISNDTSQRANLQPEDVPLEMNDLYGAISYTLYHQIPLKKTIIGQQLNILKRFFDIIERYFPADDDKFLEFIKNLNLFLKSNEQELDINDFLNHLKINNYDFKSKFQGWITCKGSELRYRGYTCSLWSLFHTLTINEYQKEKDTQKWVNLHEVLFTMRDYIGNFFSCTDCAQHFTTMASNLENELKLPNSSVIWLWQAHNRVNKRLKGDLTEDPEHPKASYPYQKDCPQCYLKNGDFDQDEVWKYLMDRYGHIKKTMRKMSDETPRAENLTFQSDPDSFKNNRVFNYTDYSLIFGLYILITTIVMAVFFYLPIRIKRKAKIFNSRSNLVNRHLDV